MLEFRSESHSITQDTTRSVDSSSGYQESSDDELLSLLWDSEASSPITVGVFVVGLIAILSAAPDIIHRFKLRNHPRDFTKRQDQIENMFAIGLIPLAVGEFLPGGILFVVAIVSIVFGAVWSFVEITKSVYNVL